MIALIWIFIAIFKYSEMTFIPFVLAFIRYKINIDSRKWIKWIDSFSALDIGYIVSNDTKVENKVDFDTKLDKMKQMEEKLNKI
jgi:hypothetical protein